MNLTTEEQNFIKDVLKAIGRDDGLTTQFARALDTSEIQFNATCDSIFRKCENGRVTFEYGGNGPI